MVVLSEGVGLALSLDVGEEIRRESFRFGPSIASRSGNKTGSACFTT